MKLIDKIKSSMRKEFRIVKNDLACPEAFYPLRYRIEQKHTILFFIHWWGTPVFAPPHNFEDVCDAIKHIIAHYPNSVVYDYHSENKCEL